MTATSCQTRTEPAAAFGPERLYLPAESTPRHADPEKRLLAVTITTRHRDREGDVVEPGGLAFENFLKNPVVLWAHNLAAAPVGRVRSVTVRADRVDAVVQFADTPTGREIHQLYAEGYLRAWSIGFLPRAWAPLAPETDRAADSGADAPRGFHITAAEVVELSAVPVPANPQALTLALQRGALTLSRPVRTSLEMTGPEAGTPRPDAAATPAPAQTAPTRPGASPTLPMAIRTAAARLRRCFARELLRALREARGELA